MNKAAIRNFAIWARNKLIADVSYKAGLIGITAEGIKEHLPQSIEETQFFDIGTAEPYAISGEEIKQRASLVNIINQKTKETDYATAYKYIIEGVAYTWFNRLIAVRFMEVNDYLPSHIRVLSSESGKLEPDLVTTPFDADLPFTDTEKKEIIQLKNDNNLDACFRMLFIKQCNALNEILPALFQKTSDYTEVLLSISAIDKEGVVYHLVNDIPEENFNIEQGGQVEIIGWMYQYYNTEPKNKAFAKSGKITKEEIPAVTQLFTPDWIVRYMVENSLGRIWVEGHPNDSLKASWKYYLEEAVQEPDVQAKLDEIHAEYAKLKPEDIHFIDPCMGSGHILVYAFDVLMQIYQSVGYSERDAARSILENNLYGLDIDDRAYQMAYFAVMMKARQYNRRILSAETPCHVYSIQDSNNINRNQLKYFGADLSEIEKNDAMNQLTGLLDTFKDAKEYGSILDVENYDWVLVKRFAGSHSVEGQMSLDTIGIDDTQETLLKIIAIGATMARKYTVVITNPPYMGTGSMDKALSSFIAQKYPEGKADLFSAFILKCRNLCQTKAYYAMITQHSWMFLSSFSKMRAVIYDDCYINMVHLGARAFEDISGEVVQSTAFVMKKQPIEAYRGTYVKLIDEPSTYEKEQSFLAKKKTHVVSQELFNLLPGKTISYWLSEQAIKGFTCGIPLRNISKPKTGMRTGDNERFLRLWFEVSFNKVGLHYKSSIEANDSGNKWFPYNKGGEFRLWYGNNALVVNWENDGREIKDNTRRVYPQLGENLSWKITNESDYFKQGITWTALTSGKNSFRFSDAGFIFDSNKGPMLIIDDTNQELLLGFLNSIVAHFYLKVINPTLSLQNGDLENIPIIQSDGDNAVIQDLVDKNVLLSRRDWDSFETSWDFKKHPLI